MIVSINQPAYLPWLGYCHRIAVSDLHIVLDHVEFEKNSFVNRNRVRTDVGWCWLTVPVKTKGHFGELPIDRIQIDNRIDWSKKHLRTLQQYYRGAPHFAEHEAFLAEVYSTRWDALAGLCEVLTEHFLSGLGINTPLERSSEMQVEGARDELVLNLCRAVGATTYLSGPLGRRYLREELFERAGITVRYHDYVHPAYPQRHEPFQPFMSVFDLIANCGPESSRFLMGGQGETP